MMRRRLPLARLPDRLAPDRGLTAAEVHERRQRYGSNDIVETGRNPLWELLRDTARDPMIWFLVGTGTLYTLVGERLEGLTLLAGIVPLVGMDLFLHRRTQASTAGLQSRLAAVATVFRAGAEIAVAAVDLVPGDLAIVASGEPFPADGIVVDGAEAQADEATLSGEAFPVRKRPLADWPSDGEEPLVAAEHWGFAGTRLLTGSVVLRVVYTGRETLYGEIIQSAASGAKARTPLQGAIASLVSVLVAVAAVLCLMLAFVRLHQGYGWVDALVSALTLAVAALPEEFPVVFTFFLGVGVYRLAKRQALVRRAVSVENIGRTTCICSDKTGTITEGRLEVRHLVPTQGMRPDRLLALAATASRRDSGDPLDAAIWRRADAEPAAAVEAQRIDTFPFTEERKRETTIVRGPDGRMLAATKGAPELILSMTTLTDTERATWAERVMSFAEDGHKVIACAWRPLAEAAWQGGEPDRAFEFAGLLACEDPIRDGVAEAIAQCRAAGIHPIMVTGDHPATARAVAREIGLGCGASTIITGDEIDARLSEAGADLRTIDVIARAMPSQKLTLVRRLQEQGESVAVTGDGVNDVPALHAADVGIAMGERGTRSAREAASIILLDDNFRTIVRAIAEGRQLFRNLRLSFVYLLTIHIPFIVSAALIPFAGYPLLYLPIHIVWLELIIHPTALLVFQDFSSNEHFSRLPQRKARFFSNRDWAGILLAGSVITTVVVAAYLRSLEDGHNVEHARAMALAALTLVSAALAATLSRLRTGAARWICMATVALSVLLIQTPGLSRVVHLQPLHMDDWLAAILAALLAAGVTMGAGVRGDTRLAEQRAAGRH